MYNIIALTDGSIMESIAQAVALKYVIGIIIGYKYRLSNS